MNFLKSKGIYVATFLLSFFIFVLITFPFDVLSGTLSRKMSELTGLDISIESLSSNLPIGIGLEGVKVSLPGGEPTELQGVQLGLSLFSLLTGDFGVFFKIDNEKNGELEVDIDFPISEILTGKGNPSQFKLESKNFLLTDLIKLGFHYYANLPGINPLIGPMLDQFIVKMSMDSEVDIKIDSSDLNSSEGDANIRFGKLILESTDPALGIPAQNFKKAAFLAKMSAGKLTIDQKSQFESDQLGLNFSGDITLMQTLPRSKLSMEIGMRLAGAIKENIGSLIALLLLKTDATSWNGKATLQIGGTVSSPSVMPLLDN